MPAPFVAVEWPTADTTQPEAAALVASCSAGISGTCAASEGNSTRPDAIAVVSFRGASRLSALVEVGRTEAGARSWRSQELRFKDEDASVERFKTLGLVIATLFLEWESAPQQDELVPQDELAPARSPAKPLAGKLDNRRAEARPTVVAKPARGWFSLGGLAGYDLRLPSALRWGGRLGVAAQPLRWPAVVALSGSYAMAEAMPGSDADSSLRVSWLSLGFGFGLRTALPLANSEARLLAQGVLVDVAVRASYPGEGSDSGHRWLGGGELALEIAPWRTNAWGPALGLNLQQLSGATDLRIHGEKVAQVAGLSAGAYFVLELRPFRTP